MSETHVLELARLYQNSSKRFASSHAICYLCSKTKLILSQLFALVVHVFGRYGDRLTVLLGRSGSVVAKSAALMVVAHLPIAVILAAVCGVLFLVSDWLDGEADTATRLGVSLRIIVFADPVEAVTALTYKCQDVCQ
jgi:hypothetical protein